MNLAHQEYKTYKSLYKALQRQTQEGGAHGGAPGMKWRDFGTGKHAIPADITTMVDLLRYAGISLSGTSHTAGDYILKIRCKPHTHPAGCWGNADRLLSGESCPEHCEEVEGRTLEWGAKACKKVFGADSSKGCITWEIPAHCRPADGPRNFRDCITQGHAQWRLILREIDTVKEAVEENVDRFRKALEQRNTEKFKHLRIAQEVAAVREGRSTSHASSLRRSTSDSSPSLGRSSSVLAPSLGRTHSEGAIAQKRRADER